MARTEDAVISAVLRGAGVRTAIKAGVSRNLFQHRQAEWRFLEENPDVSKATFKTRFPEFKIYAVEPDELPVLVKQQQRNMADYELAQIFRKYQQVLTEEDPIELTGKITKDLQEVVAKYSRGGDVNLIDDWQRMYTHVEQRALALQAGTVIGYKYGIPSLDKIFGGLQAPDLVTILARQGEMKTWLSLFICANCVLEGAKPMYVSLEMSPEQVGLRLHTILSRMLAASYADQFKTVFQNQALMGGNVDLKQYRKFLLRMRKVIKRGIIVPDSRVSGSIEQLQARIEEHHPDVLFYDYFGLDIGEGRIENWMEAEAMSHGFKGLAKQYNIPVVLNAQASRAATNTKEHPQLEHAAYTDSIGRDSDRVLSLKLRRGELSAYIAKNRFGSKDKTIRFNTDVDKGILDEIVMPEVRRRGHLIVDDDED